MNKLFDHKGVEVLPPSPQQHLMSLEDAFGVMPVSLAANTIQTALISAYGEEEARSIVRSMV